MSNKETISTLEQIIVGNAHKAFTDALHDKFIEIRNLINTNFKPETEADVEELNKYILNKFSIDVYGMHTNYNLSDRLPKAITNSIDENTINTFIKDFERYNQNVNK